LHPVNATLLGYKSHNMHRFNILDGDEINTRNFAAVTAMIASAKSSVLIGNEISAFIPLSHRIISRKQQLLKRVLMAWDSCPEPRQPSLFRPDQARLIQP
jgi:hypothetical protein